MTKYCVCLSYYETKSSKVNLQFFLEHAIVPDADYVVIINGFRCTVALPSGITVLRRDNTGGDFGAWGSALALIDISMYTHFVLLNDTVRGPFLPRYIPPSLSWLDLFTSKLDNQTKLVGLTMNYFPWDSCWCREKGQPNGRPLSICQFHSAGILPKNEMIHVQSMCTCTDLVGLQLLLSHGIFKTTDIGMKDAHQSNEVRKKFILDHEIGMSQVILQSGYRITALQMTENKSIPTGDVHSHNQYFGTCIHPLEVLFVKSDRFSVDRYSAKLLDLHTFCSQ